MKIILSANRHHYVARLSIFLITAAFVWAMIGCESYPVYEYELTISSTTGGSVADPGEGSFLYAEGSTVYLIAVAEEGYRFVNWEGDVGTVDNVTDDSTTIEVKGEYSITANFTKILAYNLTVSTTVGGWIITPGVGTFTYAGGTKADLEAREDVGYGFVNWTGDVDNIDNFEDAKTTITMEGNYEITANFKEEEAVTVTDPNLEAAIRAATDIPERSIYPSDLKRLTLLHAEQRNVSDLTALKYCTCLTRLYLYNNQIDDISPITNLTSLRELYLSGNQISDISALANLTSLRELYLSGNQISDISPLANLTSLTELNLSGNQISDISPLANLTSLGELNLSGNQISDISPLANLTSLTYLSLSGNQISNISALASLTSLRDLSLGGNQISGVSPLANLTSLTLLNLSDNQISDIEPLVDNPGLSQGDKVYLSNNPLSSSSTNTYIPRLEARGVIVEY